MPEEFVDDEEEDFIPLEIHWAPEKFIAFVDSCSNEIREILENPNMTKEEMLDALAFGDFEKHKMQCEMWRIKRLIS
jgi:hypothetical protein